MGMFDYLICEMPLPDYPDFDKVYTFQTKCTPSQCMTTYKINKDGSLFVKKSEQKWVEDDSLVGGHMEETDVKWVVCDNYTGQIVFYDYYVHADYTTNTSDEFDIGCIEYTAVIIDSKVAKLVCTKNVAPVHLSKEEVKARRKKSEIAIAENRQKMFQFRKDNPSAMQKFADDIDNLIKSKPVLYDQTDLIKIINNIQQRVLKWREIHDPWHETDFQ
jgi:hypothetical protein